MKKLWIAILLSTFILSWDRPTTRENGTIVSLDTEIVYRIKDGDFLLGDMIPVTSVILSEVDSGITHTYKVSALAEDSEYWSKPATIVWTSPPSSGGGGCSMRGDS